MTSNVWKSHLGWILLINPAALVSVFARVLSKKTLRPVITSTSPWIRQDDSAESCKCFENRPRKSFARKRSVCMIIGQHSSGQLIIFRTSYHPCHICALLGYSQHNIRHLLSANYTLRCYFLNLKLSTIWCTNRVNIWCVSIVSWNILSTKARLLAYTLSATAPYHFKDHHSLESLRLKWSASHILMMRVAITVGLIGFLWE